MDTAQTVREFSWWHAFLVERDRLLATPRFQRWAASFPLTRFIARKRARETFDLVAGFVYSQILTACVRLNLFEILADGAQSITALSSRMSLRPEAAQRLIDAAIALELVERRGELFGLGRLGAPLVGNKAIKAMVEHHAMFYDDLRDPVALLREERRGSSLGEYWSYASIDAPDALSTKNVRAYTELMSASQPLVTEEILDAVPFHKFKCLLDVGGGDGTFIAAAGSRFPRLSLKLFDLPPVVEIAQQKLIHAGLTDRAVVAGGSFLRDALPTGADIISFVRVIHDHDDESVKIMLRAAHQALPIGGTLLIAEPMSDVAGARTMGDAYFGFYLWAMGSGRPRSAKRLGELLVEAGFETPRQIPTRQPLQTSILLARKLSV